MNSRNKLAQRLMAWLPLLAVVLAVSGCCKSSPDDRSGRGRPKLGKRGRSKRSGRKGTGRRAGPTSRGGSGGAEGVVGAKRLKFAPGQLESHFRKHRHEFRYKTKQQYLAGARRLAQGGPGVESIRKGGDRLFYRRKTNEFEVVVPSRLRLRTYFKPSARGRYWKRQKSRRPRRR